MSDIKMFRIGTDSAIELSGGSSPIEKSLQILFERNLEPLLGIRFLASEYSTGPVHGGRIDTLGIDEDGSPVIIEYKRALNENVINQGLFYLDWLLDHRREFQWLVMERLGKDVADIVEWSSPRLMCIAGDFTRYDGYAVKQIARNIELLRYRRFDDDLLMIELVHAPSTAARSSSKALAGSTTSIAPLDEPSLPAKDKYLSQRIDYRLQNASPALRDVWDAAVASLEALGDDVQLKELKLYYAFKRIKNFACLEIYPQAKVVNAFLKVDPDSVVMEDGFTRDMRGIGHFGTGDLMVTLQCLDDVAKALPLFVRSYDGS